ncbi:hypothetical protein PSN45_005004 [Yamadazyma tenuis]|uniref:LicD/FKTN/FKRP nucleotidyltransferase domain-containing protein n=1 Tax=Candida tenuis (strain ATCC 10573 / BCRC 21748 / CBS 615 / JCM 9827 / NBRC 10315 / NRRL Y-1498 / VKM Y-70) TaxID=590646 RepID=G3B2G1_CANTC|nr:uncharacterized protein CANTEDRAFT_104345 [Yamadazyma tenuis ATCC 10573]EGV64665.1 hypothetical protein CANTEDRAFT_104345 [Yamadazyma tenuis ATCC 10573]WEJ97453.1 hypothetical protein PSN45_005004 [Yamadazyma tenuis]
MKPSILPLQKTPSNNKFTARRIFHPRFFKLILVLVALGNIIYIALYMIDEGSSRHIKNKFKSHVSIVLDSFTSDNDSSEKTHNLINFDTSTPAPSTGEVHDDLPPTSQDSELAQKLYTIPDKPYNELTDSQKILHRLNEITTNKDKYWLAHTELKDVELSISINDFMQETWVNNPTLFYDPRFTLSIYINEIKTQFLEKNPHNDKEKLVDIVVPFSWSDWVDLTMLNEEFMKEESDRKTCEYMKATHHMTPEDPNYCINNQDITDEDLEVMSLPSTEFVPGFAVKKSPTNKASNEVRMLEGKSHLLTYAKNPFKLIFLSHEGVYEVQVEEKKRLVDSDLFHHYLTNKNIQNYDAKIILNPVNEFKDFMAKVPPQPLSGDDDAFDMVAKIKDPDHSKSKEIYLPETVFDYQQDKIDSQIQHYEERLTMLNLLTSDELIFNEKGLEDLRLSRNEFSYYNGLKYADSFAPDKEETYFRMARLTFDTNDKNHDAGWHYEWRFFNGAMRYLKKGWNRDELLIRDKVLLDRILRNWFRFANEKGIISWIAHGPLLSWYWDGLLFPFDEDIDIQMPAVELTRLAKLYNQTLVIEDLTEGFGKYFIDCSTFLHHRGETGRRQNHIDARFIDIDTGSYIDITGLGISDEPAPEKYQEIIDAASRDGKPRPVYNCRNLHFTSYEEISPLRYSMLGGVPVYVPNQIESILVDEYHDGIKQDEFKGWYFVDAMNLWIHGSNLTFLFEEDPQIVQDYKESDGQLIPERFLELVRQMDDSKVLKLLESNEDIMLEYYLTKNATELHRKELSYMYEMPNGDKTLMKDVGHMHPSGQISDNKEYHKYVGQNFKFQKPFRRPLFNYEYIDRPKHHKTYVTGP